MGGLVNVLESAPPADIVYQHPAKVGPAGGYVGNELLEPLAFVDLQTAEPVISVGPDDIEVIACGIGTNGGRLVFDRVPLVNSRHAHILGCAPLTFTPR